MVIDYIAPEKRRPDPQYRNLLDRIMSKGEWVPYRKGENSLMVLGHEMRFDLKNGFPIITERDLVSPPKKGKSIYYQALGELSAFLNGARTQEELESFGCNWWKTWVTPEKCLKRGLDPGDLGPGSYGPAWRRFPTLESGHYDQISNVIEQIRERPHLRTHFISSFIPQYAIRGKEKQQKVVVVPCHGTIYIHINVLTKELSLHHYQRSADVPVGLVCNLVQYAALTLMFAQVTGYAAKELVYTISNAHIYQRQISDVYNLLIKTEPRILPTVTIDRSVKNIFQFRQHHFKVEDYLPQSPRKRISTPV